MKKVQLKASRFPFLMIGAILMTGEAQAVSRNQVMGSWQMMSATIEKNGKQEPAYGAHPNGLLTFTADMYYIEVLTDADVPRFASDERGKGTDAENRSAMARNIGFFGTYTVDADGAFLGNTVEGCTFPNWVGNVRTRKDLNISVEGEQMTENFTRPGGVRIVIHWQRAR